MNDTTIEAARRSDAAEVPPPDIPAYMHEVYDWAYVNPRWVRLLDNDLVVRVLLFGNDQRLMRAYVDRIRPGMRVWQVAHVYGSLVRRVAQRVGEAGSFLLGDVTPIQVEHARRKLAGMRWARVALADAGHQPDGGRFDLVCSFFLLHEIPDAWKRRVVDNMLAHVGDHGEVLFVDYHRPRRWHPVGWLLRLVNRHLEPFAESLWHNEISHYASDPDAYVWEKRCVFGGVYQIVTVRRK